jgi:regulator of sigma E protease
MARIFGVRVDVFSIGFGPRLFGVKRGDTDYRVSALPLGGYVRMAGQDLTDVDAGDAPPTGAPDELMSKKRWQRALISFAGPAVNLILPLILLTGYYAISGVPYAAFLDKPVVVEGFPASQSADASPLHTGDRLLALNSVQNPTWERAQNMLFESAPGTIFKAKIEKDGVTRDVDLSVKNDPYARPLGYLPIPPVIGEVGLGTPADHAGLHAGDKVRSVNGTPIEYWDQFVDNVRHSEGKSLSLTVERTGGQTVNLSVTPKQGLTDSTEKNYQIGVIPEPGLAYRKVNVVQAVGVAGEKTVDFVAQTVAVLGKLLSGRVSVKQLQSFVGISRTAGQAVSEGPSAVISFMALISVNLGILNLLPIPILDGGHILLLSLEGIRRRDFSLAFKERFIQVGLVFLLVLIVYVMYNDVMRMLPTHS